MRHKTVEAGRLEKVIYSERGSIAEIIMACDRNLNAIDEQMADELLISLTRAEASPYVKAVLLRSGGRAFSSGGDIRYFYQQIQSGEEVDLDPLIRKVGQLADFMKRMGKLIVIAVGGVAAGAGVSLALGGDFILCADNASFILAFSKLGLVPDTGASYLLSKCIGSSRTLALAVTGRPVTAKEAIELGLVHMVIPTDELEETALRFTCDLATGPLVVYNNLKRQLYDASFSDYARWLSETEVQTQHECSLTTDFRERVLAFVEKRKPSFKGQ